MAALSAASLPYLIDHHEVPLVPMDDARQRHLVAELLPGNALLCERIKHSSAPGRVGEGGLHTSIVVVEDGCGAVLEPGLFLREDF